MAEAVDSVTSEVHTFTDHVTDDPLMPVAPGNVLSQFTFTCPAEWDEPCNEEASNTTLVTVDKDGDFVVLRKNKEVTKEEVITIEHCMSTPLNLVGLQVWRGALLLADFLLHHRCSLLRGQTVLELGAGVGLTSIVAAMFAKKVVCTDVDRGSILKLIKNNVHRNNHLVKGNVTVKEIDFFSESWHKDLCDLLLDVTVITAADVVYHHDLTDAFFRTVQKLLSEPSRKTVYIALEKRYVFTISDLDVVAPCYEYFLAGLEKLKGFAPASHCWSVEEISTDFPQYFNYEKVPQLVLWKVTSEITK